MSYNKFLKMRSEYEQKRQSKIKKLKRFAIATLAGLTASTIALISSICYDASQDKTYYPDNDIVTTTQKVEEKTPYERLQALRKVKFQTEQKYHSGEGKYWDYVSEQDVLEYSAEMAKVLEGYYKDCGAGNWTTNDQFWPEDIKYIVTAMAFKESSYRPKAINNLGYAGLTAIGKSGVFDTLDKQWFAPHIWNDSIPDVNCNQADVDVFNPATSIEYTYHYLGYIMANRFKKDKYFKDGDGKSCVWTELDYSEEMQNRLLIASYFWGMGNVTNAVFGRPNEDGVIVPLEKYIYSEHVEKILDKTYELIDTYENNLSR